MSLWVKTQHIHSLSPSFLLSSSSPIWHTQCWLHVLSWWPVPCSQIIICYGYGMMLKSPHLAWRSGGLRLEGWNLSYINPHIFYSQEFMFTDEEWVASYFVWFGKPWNTLKHFTTHSSCHRLSAASPTLWNSFAHVRYLHPYVKKGKLHAQDCETI